MENELSEILNIRNPERISLIPTLEKVQEESGYISEEAIAEIARLVRMSESQVFGVASFYSHFRFAPPGRHSIKVCLGTACHVIGGKRILEELERELGIKSGETTGDLRFSLESVNCLGCCALGPLIVVDEQYHAKLTPAKAINVLKEYD